MKSRQNLTKKESNMGKEKLGKLQSPEGSSIQRVVTQGEWAGGIPWQFFAAFPNESIPAHELCTAAFCVVTYHNRLVIVEHVSRGFELPGGHIDPDEAIANTVEREVREEVGARINSPQFFGYKRVSPPAPIPHRDNPNLFYPFPHSYVPYFYAEAIELFNIPLASDVKQVKIVSLDEAKSLFAPGHNHHHIVEDLIKQKAITLK
jgi:8-oxo-dGTP pyrophosphatase MutT (NUDIX family)